MTGCVITLFGNLVAPERRVENLDENTCSTIVPINHAVTTISCELDVAIADLVVDEAAEPPPEEETTDPNATTSDETTEEPVEAPTTENPFKEYYDYLWALYKWYTAQVRGGSSRGASRGGCAPRRRVRRGYAACGYGGYGGHGGGYGGYGGGHHGSCHH